MLGEKNDSKWMKKGGEMFFFPHLVKSMHIFFLLTLNIQNLRKKKFLRRSPPQYNKFHLGKKQRSRRGEGENMNYKFNIHP